VADPLSASPPRPTVYMLQRFTAAVVSPASAARLYQPAAAG
jgi:hypothetical protein